MIAEFGDLAVRRQGRFEYGGQDLIETVQFAGVHQQPPETGLSVLHQRLNAFEFVAGFA